jgi:glycosyltransferase involved in cell wall biosynthesis
MSARAETSPDNHSIGAGAARRKLLMVARMRYRLPLSPGLERKFLALRDRFELRVLASASGPDVEGDDTFRLARPFAIRPLDGAAFYASLPLRVVAELRDFRADAVLCQSPFEGLAVLAGRRLARSRAAVIVELHGDWRTFARLYGSGLRRVVAPLTDRVATLALRRADGVRTLSPFTTRLARDVGVEPTASFVAFTDLETFTAATVRPVPEQPQALFVGVLEAYKNIDGLAAAWRLAAPRLPSARLRIIGDGPRRDAVQALVADLPAQTSWQDVVPNEEIVRRLDESWCLLLPSRSEGTPRVVIEAFCRGRAVVGSAVGGVPDVLEDGVTGLMVDPDDPRGIADALVRLLQDRALTESLGRAGRERMTEWTSTPEEFARRMANLVERAVTRRNAAVH